MNTETLGLVDCAESSPISGRATLARSAAATTIRNGEVAVRRDLRRGSVMRVISGLVWLTQEDTGGDHVLGSGQCFRFGSGKPVVVESLLGDAVVEYQ